MLGIKPVETAELNAPKDMDRLYYLVPVNFAEQSIPVLLGEGYSKRPVGCRDRMCIS